MASSVVTIPPTTTRGERLLGLRTDLGSYGSRQQAQAGSETGHDYWTHLVEAAFFESVHRALFTLRAANSRKKNHRS